MHLDNECTSVHPSDAREKGEPRPQGPPGTNEEAGNNKLSDPCSDDRWQQHGNGPMSVQGTGDHGLDGTQAEPHTRHSRSPTQVCTDVMWCISLNVFGMCVSYMIIQCA